MEKAKRKFNLVDCIVVLALVAVVVFAVSKFIPVKESDTTENILMEHYGVKYEITFYTEESTDYSLEKIKVGDAVSDESNNIAMGYVTEKPVLKPSEAIATAADGTSVVSPKAGYSSTYITFEGDGYRYLHGAKFNIGQYSVGQTVTLRVGEAKVYGRIYDIRKVG